MASSMSQLLLTTLSPSPLPLLQLPSTFSLHNVHVFPTNLLQSKPSFYYTNKASFAPPIVHRSSNFNRSVTIRSSLNFPLISPQDHWGTWTALLATGAFGLWSEKTKIGSMISAALVSILVGLAASNLGIIPYEAPAYSVVMEFLLPLTIPLLLFRADLRNVIQSTGTLFLAFLLGSVATVVGTVVAFLLVPMKSLGQDSWKIAAALMGSYIGGGNMLRSFVAHGFGAVSSNKHSD